MQEIVESWLRRSQVSGLALWRPLAVRRGRAVSLLQGAELLVHRQDVVVQLSREKQVLQGAHVLLNGHMVLWEGREMTVCQSQFHPQSWSNNLKP